MNANSSNNPKQTASEIGTIIQDGKILVQFDGLCVLCSRTIHFLLKADRKNKFIFQALQNSPEGQNSDTIIITDKTGEKLYYSDAVLKIGKELGGFYQIIQIFKILPRSWRDSIYKWIARNRFRWFGRRQSCYLPTDYERKKFI
jgi:predicted DCC family thiol-disulfide oxidoreductase YuxK